MIGFFSVLPVMFLYVFYFCYVFKALRTLSYWRCRKNKYYSFFCCSLSTNLAIRDPTRKIHLTMESKCCCCILQNPEELTGKKGKARTRFIHMHLLGAKAVGHYDCFEAILALNGDINYFSGVKGKIFRQGIKEVRDCNGELCTNHPKYPDSELFKLLVDYGLDVSDLFEDITEFYASNPSPRSKHFYLNPINIMTDHAAGSLAILLQKEYGSLSQDSSRRAHRGVVSQAVKKADEELVNRLVDAGTNKQELLS